MARDEAIHLAAQELARSAQAARLGRHVPIDGAALAGVIDRELARLLLERRSEVLQSLSHRLSRAIGMLDQLRAGLSVHDPSVVVMELSAVAGALRVVAALTEAPRAA